jgi:hypothetical protein
VPEKASCSVSSLRLVGRNVMRCSSHLPNKTGSAEVRVASSARDSGFSLSESMLKMFKSRQTRMEAIVRFCVPQ